MLHRECPTGQKLMDAYLEAIRLSDHLMQAPCSENRHEQALIVRDLVRDARAKYWNHVNEHKCRKP